ncbi:NAD(P)-dependent dehydrogenase, short-chain alcohol dehydrogenase family [Eubacterium maltosivorans]|uniref:SDR family NAD(P)-dependent oxidoreductase n=1 Tax=Eubacterium maltosivorans TaxID=2041044 RepID=UPI0008856F3F|nr:SDR family oxidoreductase [Eubacterium maltosivorans]MBS6340310.1 SDR family oxidoreductase [Eubacterium limosum]WPK79279.1 3-beta-hydroxycholanate 3-dehydrogenase (NADP(+)) [Eubacterium maltosivorans]SDP70498.1 NAD(P)-dependent dehydrogenase, short-chain alcohol dehydrogenase family [Eubacterium maltosivorans]
MKKIFPERFKDQVIVLTGAARGIGKATALRAVKEGAKLVLADRLKKEGEEVLKAVKEEGGEAIFLCLDLSIEENARKMVEEAVRIYGQIDIAINNAGVMGNPDPVHALTKEQMDYTMANNFYSVFYSCKYELQQFMDQGKGGAIVNNASIAGLTGLPGNPAYVASKHAVNGLTKNLALDYARFGIRVNSVNPAGTDTPMVKEAYEFVVQKQKEAKASGTSEQEAQSMAGQKTESMLKRDAQAEEQAASILFLASDDASHMTGEIVATDGGWTSF